MSRTSPRPHAATRWPLLACLLLALVAGAWAAPATNAAVAFRAASPATAATAASTTSIGLPIPQPSGLATNDVLLVVMRWSGSGGSAVTTTWTPPAGWTELEHNDSTGNSVSSTALWWKRATAADAATPTFTFTAAWTGGAKDAIASGGMMAFVGAAPTGNPFAWSSAAQIQGNPPQSSVTFPRDAGTYAAGSMSVSLGGFRRVKTTCCTAYTGDPGAIDLTGVGTGTLGFSAPSTGNSVPGLTAGAAYEPANASGKFPSATTATLSANANWSAWTLILTPASPCGTGDLTLAEPSTVSFGSVALSGTDQIATSNATFIVDDQTSLDGATSAGWNVSLNASQFTSGGNALPATALSIISASSADAGGRCAAPTNPVGYPLTVPAGAATKIYAAAANTGRGASIVTLGLRLAVPARARIGAYGSVWTMTLSSGP